MGRPVWDMMSQMRRPIWDIYPLWDVLARTLRRPGQDIQIRTSHMRPIQDMMSHLGCPVKDVPSWTSYVPFYYCPFSYCMDNMRHILCVYNQFDPNPPFIHRAYRSCLKLLYFHSSDIDRRITSA